VLLGYAIANTTRDKLLDFNSFAGLWREQGDIRNLIRKSAPFTSFLDGEGFYQQILENAFKQNLENVSDNHDWYSDFGELDLFITATDFQGRDTKTFDHTGNVIDVKDHKVVFCLKYRQDQIDYIDNPFSRDDNNIKALATLCRATSCFPIAFPVVEVSLYPPDEQSKYPLHKKLVDWGNLQNRDLPKEYLNGNKPYTIKLVDGGVLNNRPFTYAVETIYSRVAYRNAERILFYLDPTPDRFQEDIKQKNSEDSPWEIASKSKIGIPNYQSINKDLQLIEEGNLKVNRYKLLRASVESSIDFNNLPQRNDMHNCIFVNFMHFKIYFVFWKCIR
jgi:patatin-related protein